MTSLRFRRGLGLATIVLLGVAVRLVSFERIFTPAYVNFQGDAWYHLRRLDWFLRNAPSSLTTDPYVGNEYIPLPPLFDWILGAFALLFGGTESGSYRADVAAALAAPILGGLCAVPSFYWARRMFGGRTAWISALLVVLLPGSFMARSMVGVADHHVAEVLLTLCIFAALARPVLDQRAFAISSIAGGFFLAAYALTWSGSPFIAPALIAWVSLEAIVAAAWGRPKALEPLRTAAAAGLGWILVGSFQPAGLYRRELQLWALAAVAASALGCAALTLYAQRSGRRAGIASVVAAFTVALLIAQRVLPENLVGEIGRVFGSGSRSVGETRSLFSLTPQAPLEGVRVVLGDSWIGLLLVPGLLVTACFRESRDRSLLAAWIILTFFATGGQNRFGYYAVPAGAMLLGWGFCLISGLNSRVTRVRLGLVTVLLATFLAFQARTFIATIIPLEGASMGWHQALSWLRKSSPEPFGDPSVYTASYEGKRLTPDYRILTWWDYGYFVTRIARRPSVANPSQANASAAASMLLGDGSDAAFDAYGVRYVAIADEMLASPGGDDVVAGKFGAIADWAGRPMTDFVFAGLEKNERGEDFTVLFFRPPYFNTLAARLFLFAGKGAMARDVWVVSLTGNERATRVTGARRFDTFTDALRYRETLGPGIHEIVSRSPAVPCIDVRPSPGYALVYESDDKGVTPDGRSSVRVFERTPGR